ncbi:MAG: hypothetical protein AB7S48_15235 [Bacteroidales bacterium]
MKRENNSKTIVNTLDKFELLMVNAQKLDMSAMKSICGGDGEDNGGSDIIMPIPIPDKK